MEVKKKILLTNDDGFYAPGIRMLYDVLSGLYDVTVIAPEKEQSGVGHAFTYHRPLHYLKSDNDMKGYIVSGSPADCVKFAVSYLLPALPDIVISGLNIGENSGLSAFYSGTVAAAREGAFWSIPSIAFSVCEDAKEYALDYAGQVPDLIRKIFETEQRATQQLSKIFYNVNFPPCSPESVRGTKVTWQSMAFFDDRYEKIEVESHETKEGYLIYGEKKNVEMSDAYDSRALMNKYITITPLTFDSTAHSALPHLMWLNERGNG